MTSDGASIALKVREIAIDIARDFTPGVGSKTVSVDEYTKNVILKAQKIEPMILHYIQTGQSV